MLDPAVATVRRFVREALVALSPQPTVALVALSGGADSAALAEATAFEAPKLGMAVASLTVDHGLQDGSEAVAERAVQLARDAGIADAQSVRVQVEPSADGPEAAARAARYDALATRATAIGAGAVLLGHTLDDQAESVLLGLARGAGAASLAGMAPVRVTDDGIAWIRPLLRARRSETIAASRDLDVWHDPHNVDPAFARVRVRERVLPLLEAELGPGVALALARTADQLREDAAAFQDMIDETIEDICEPAEAGIAVSVAALAANPAAIRNRIIRHVVRSEFDASLTRTQTLEVARLVTHWRGQGPIDLPGCIASRAGSLINFAAR